MFDEDVPAPSDDVYFVDILMLMGELSVCCGRFCDEHTASFASPDNLQSVVLPFVLNFAAQNGIEHKTYDLRLLNLTTSQWDKLVRHAGAPRLHAKPKE
jgi:hypothetical protein